MSDLSAGNMQCSDHGANGDVFYVIRKCRFQHSARSFWISLKAATSLPMLKSTTMMGVSSFMIVAGVTVKVQARGMK